MTLIQSLGFVERNFNFDIYSFVIKKARDVNKAVELLIIRPMPGFINDIVCVEIADPGPIKVSVKFNNIFFLFKFSYFFCKIHHQF